jgi:AraC family transcriptional regulator
LKSREDRVSNKHLSEGIKHRNALLSESGNIALDPQIEAIGMMLLAELKQESLGGRLYVESLANMLAVHLLRQYAAPQSQFIVYESGLSERQILQVVEYIDAHLNQDIKLADLAALLGISESHLSHQ